MKPLGIARAGLASLCLCLAACGPTASAGDDDPGPGSGADGDGDGYRASVDCADGDARIHPGAEEVCNGLDDDCSGRADDPFDLDLDGFAQCLGDCDDADPGAHPGATETQNGRDDDCDGTPDNHLPEVDDDGDGFAEVMGDCDDGQPLVNPGAVEVAARMDGSAEGVDNDCDGMVDEAAETCDVGLGSDAMASAQAIELCRWVTAASWSAGAAAPAHSIVAAFGASYAPHAGSSMAALATGTAAPGMMTDPGTVFLGSAAHPDPRPDPADGCGMADPGEVNDYVELRLELDVPTNAHAFAFDFNFMSAEYPEYVCTEFDDTFVAYLDSAMYHGNVSFDSMGKPVSINIAFFTVCDPGSGSGGCTGSAPLAGTGYEGGQGGGTGWLTTTAPVTPGEHITLRFIIFDEGDWILDSAVLLDNFRWQADPVDGPVTIP